MTRIDTKSNSRSSTHYLTLSQLFRTGSTALVPLMIGVMTLVMSIQQYEMSKENRRQDVEIALETRRDLALTTYLNEMSSLMINFNFTLNIRVRSLVVRPKTLIVLQQLDSQRKALVIEYLYESNLVRGNHETFQSTTTDLKGADLTALNLNIENENYRTFNYLWLVHTKLQRARFPRCVLENAVFDWASLDGSSFRNSILRKASFFRSSLISTDFTDADLTDADLTLADLTGSTITDEQLFSAQTFHRAILPNGTQTFYRNLLKNSDLADCSLKHWQTDLNHSVTILRQHENCLFQVAANYSTVTIRQRFEYDRVKSENRFNHYLEIRINIVKIRSSSLQSFVRLSKGFFNENDFLLDQDEFEINTTQWPTGKTQTKVWVTDIWKNMERTKSIDLFVNFDSTVACDNIQLFLENQRLYDEEESN